MDRFRSALKDKALWQIITMIVGIILIIMKIGDWKRGVEDHLGNQDYHIAVQDQNMKDLIQNLREENIKIDALKESLQKNTSRLTSVEEWIKLDTANQNPRNRHAY